MLPYIQNSERVHSDVDQCNYNFLQSCAVQCFTMVRHLPSGIKRLLTLQNLDAYRGPAVTQLNHVFRTTYADATLKGAETGWLVLTVRIANVISTSMPTDSIRLARC